MPLHLLCMNAERKYPNRPQQLKLQVDIEKERILLGKE